MRKALIINEGYSDNFGDQAINKSMHELFQDLGFTTAFLHFSKPSLTSVPNYNYQDRKPIDRKSPKRSRIKGLLYLYYWLQKNRKTVLSAIRKEPLDVVVIGGGQLLNSSGTFAPSGFAISLFWLSKLIKKYSNAKIYLIGVGTSGNFEHIENYLYQKAMKRIDDIWVRDQFSKDVLKTAFQREVAVIPDVAFYSKIDKSSIENHKENLALLSVTNYEEVFMKYNLEKNITKEDYYHQLYVQVDKYTSLGLSVKLVYTTLTDASECFNFKEFASVNYKFELDVCNITSLKDLTDYFDRARFVHSARMHALILGMKSDCEVKANLISQKLRSFNDEYILSTKTVSDYSKTILNIFYGRI